jgi:thiol-disulfide isomerase/thioredoxin
MSLQRVAIAALAVLFAGCSQHYARSEHATTTPPPGRAAAQRAARAQLAENTRRLQQLLNQSGTASRELEALDSLRIVGMDEGPVPDFELLAAGGGHYSSRELVGQHAFVVLFFATWCDYCDVELKSVQHALKETGPIRVIPVSADGPETWAKVPGYLARFGIRDHAVRAHEYPRFSLSYDPFDTVPLLVIVGRNGGLVDCLVGYDPAHAKRLLSSLRLAKTIGPLSKPQFDAANWPSTDWQPSSSVGSRQIDDQTAANLAGQQLGSSWNRFGQ